MSPGVKSAGNLALTLACLTMPAFAWAELTDGSSTGTRGGGDTIIVDGERVPRDIADPALCTWTSGREFLATLPGLTPFWRALDALHPYLAQRLREEAATFRVCEAAGALVPVATDDRPGFVIRRDGTQVTGIRDQNILYIDARLFRAMGARNQALFALHEILHSFIPMAAPERNNKLRTFVRTLAEYESGTASGDDLLRAAGESAVLWPHSRAALAKLDGFAVLENPQADAEHRLRAALAIGSLAQNGELLLNERELALLGGPRLEASLRWIAAVTAFDVESVRQLLSLGASPNMALPGRTKLLGRARPDTPSNPVTGWEPWWEWDPLPGETSLDVILPIEYAIAHDHLPLLRALLADPRLEFAPPGGWKAPLGPKDRGWSRVMAFAHYASVEALELLSRDARFGWNREAYQYITPFAWVLLSRPTADFARVAKSPLIDVNQRSSHQGNTPLIYCVLMKNLAAMEALLQRPDLDLEARNSLGLTALDTAVMLGQTDLAQRLREAAAKKPL